VVELGRFVFGGAKYLCEQVRLAPDNAVYGLRGRASDGADGERLGWVFGRAVVALGLALFVPLVPGARQSLYEVVSHLLDDLDLPVEARGAALDKRNIGCQTHLVHVPPRIQIVERIEDDVECLEPRDVELRVLDVVVVGLDLDVGVEPARRLFRNLSHGQRMPSYRLSAAGFALPGPWTS
jgi:hypothetical protein